MSTGLPLINQSSVYIARPRAVTGSLDLSLLLLRAKFAVSVCMVFLLSFHTGKELSLERLCE